LKWECTAQGNVTVQLQQGGAAWRNYMNKGTPSNKSLPKAVPEKKNFLHK